MGQNGRQLDVRVQGSIHVDNCEGVIDVGGCPLCLVVGVRPCNVGSGHVVPGKSGDAMMRMVNGTNEGEALDIDGAVGLGVSLLQKDDRNSVPAAFGSGQAFHIELEDARPTFSMEAGSGVDTAAIVRVGFGRVGDV